MREQLKRQKRGRDSQSAPAFREKGCGPTQGKQVSQVVRREHRGSIRAERYRYKLTGRFEAGTTWRLSFVCFKFSVKWEARLSVERKSVGDWRREVEVWRLSFQCEMNNV